MRELLSAVNGVLYYPILIIVLLACGFYFTLRTKFVQFSLFGEALELFQKNQKEKTTYLPSKHLWYQQHQELVQVI